MKTFYSDRIGILSTGYQAKGVGVEYDNNGKKKTYYIKTEKYFDKSNNNQEINFIKLHNLLNYYSYKTIIYFKMFSNKNFKLLAVSFSGD